MGSGSSQYQDINAFKKYDERYEFPNVREGKREEPNSEQTVSPLIDPSANKYDYLLVFTKLRKDKLITVDPRTGIKTVKDPEAAGIVEDEEAGGADGGLCAAICGCCDSVPSIGEGIPDDRRVYWSQVPFGDTESINASEKWWRAVPGEKDAKDKGVEELRQAWMNHYKTDTVDPDENISYGHFLEITRDLIVGTLIKRSGLQLKLTSRKTVDDDGNNIERVYCRIRAPVSLLEKKADELNYRLQFRPEVDPGPDFWQVQKPGIQDEEEKFVEIKNEEKLLMTKAGAAEHLEGMYKKGYIPASDVHIFEDEATPKHWSRRIRTLERIADKIPSCNRWNAYADFSTRPTERHLYNEYSSVRGSTIFMPKDRLYLTRQILDNIFDFAVLQRVEIVDSLFPLHDSNYGEALTTSSFLKTWIYPYLGDRDKIGAPYLSHPANDNGKTCPIYMMPWAQPLSEIREYFGESVAMYFAWLGFYGYYLLIPAIVGTGMQLLYYYGIITHYDSYGIKWYMVLFSIFMVVWANYYNMQWTTEEKICAMAWGTSGFEDAEGNRPQFHGDTAEAWWLYGCFGKPEPPRRLSQVTNQWETYYPPHKRSMKTALNMVAVSIMIFFLIIAIAINQTIEHTLVDTYGFWWALYVMHIEASIQIIVLGKFYKAWVEEANEWENHQTDTKFEDAKILKTFLFSSVNNYGAVMYQAYVTRYVFGCSSGDDDYEDCLTPLKSLLIMIFIIRAINVIQGVIEPAYTQANKVIEVQKANGALRPDDNVKIQLGIAPDSADSTKCILYCKDGNGEYVDIEPLPLGVLFLPPDNVESYSADFAAATPSDPYIAVLTCKYRSFGNNEFQSTIDDVVKPPSKKVAIFTQDALATAIDNANELTKEAMLNDMERYELEYYLEPYEGLFDEYAEIVLQMGYVVMFSLAWNMIPAVALAEILIQIRGDAYQFCNIKRRADPVPCEDVGYWSTLISYVPFCGVLSNTAIICFATNALDGWGAESKLFTWLIMEHAMLFIVNSGLFNPEEPEWIKEVEKRNAYVVDKYKNVKIDDDEGLGGAASGNLDADDLNLTAAANELMPASQEKVKYLKEQLRLTDNKIGELRRQLKKAMSGELWNEVTGVSESTMVPGLALGMLNVTILSLSGVGTERKPMKADQTRIIVAVRVNPQMSAEERAAPKGYEGPPGPAPVVSRKGTEKTKNNKKLLEINQEIQLAPIKTIKAEIVFDIVDERSRKKRASAVLPLKELGAQVSVDKSLKVNPKKGDEESTNGTLHVRAHFQYSKVKPIKERMYKVFEMKRHLEKDITNIMIGRDMEYESEWQFPR